MKQVARVALWESNGRAAGPSRRAGGARVRQANRSCRLALKAAARFLKGRWAKIRVTVTRSSPVRVAERPGVVLHLRRDAPLPGLSRRTPRHDAVPCRHGAGADVWRRLPHTARDSAIRGDDPAALRSHANPSPPSIGLRRASRTPRDSSTCPRWRRSPSATASSSAPHPEATSRKPAWVRRTFASTTAAPCGPTPTTAQGRGSARSSAKPLVWLRTTCGLALAFERIIAGQRPVVDESCCRPGYVQHERKPLTSGGCRALTCGYVGLAVDVRWLLVFVLRTI